MAISARLQGLIFSKGKRLHVLFGLVLLLITAFPLLLGQGTGYIPGALFGFTFALGGIYTGRWLCHRWLLAGNWIRLTSASLVALAGFGITGAAGYIYFFEPNIPFNHILETSINMTALSFLALFLGFVIAVTRSAIREKVNGLLLAEQKRQSELGLLRSQVSPHFLFNTLHNLYSLSINRPAEMPDLLLRLAELLRYSVYEADRPLVSLQEEIIYLRNYIALENIRMADRLKLNLDIEKTPRGIQIAPMVLIVFVENAFKHSRDSHSKTVAIDVGLKVARGKIYFSVTNSFSGDLPPNGAPRMKSGFGIANVEKRLQLLYPGEHDLQQGSVADQYHVKLWLKAI